MFPPLLQKNKAWGLKAGFTLWAATRFDAWVMHKYRIKITVHNVLNCYD